MNLASILGPIATQLITDFGEPITVTREVQGEFDPETGETGEVEVVTFTAFGVPENYKALEINGSTVLQGDLKVTIYKTTVIPIINDAFTINSIDYRVINVERTRVNGVDLIYQLQLRV